MPRINQNSSARKAANQLGADVCRLCYNHPVAAVHVMHQPNPKAPATARPAIVILQGRTTAGSPMIFAAAGVAPKPRNSI